MTINDYCDRIFCINLDRSPDRWEHAQAHFAAHGIHGVERFRAYDWHDYRGVHPHIMQGPVWACAASHQALWHMIAYHGWQRVLILEDDWQPVHSDLQARFAQAVADAPPYDLLYLGGDLVHRPIYQASTHCYRITRVHTTTSYIVTSSYARRLAPMLEGPVDCCLGNYSEPHQCYITLPRLIVQSSNLSTITGIVTDNASAMTNPENETPLYTFYDQPITP